MPIISVSLTKKLTESLEKLVKKRGYFSRSEAIRDAVRSIIVDYDINVKDQDRVFASIIVVNEFDRNDVENKLSKLRHDYNNLIIEVLHRHVEEKYCIELFLAEGKNIEITNLLARIRGIRGINQLKYTILPLT
ncbi:MAG: CopG family ribbon-helix-helix protein [Candidatus Lokiarchaeota archaeon]|nr:CopG family ribbon-helix-helix protein [Candidatus Lokiarchaeota archaeon]